MSNPPGMPPQPPQQPPQPPQQGYPQQQPPYPPQYPPQYQQPYGQAPLPPPAKGGGVLKWVLIGVGGLILLVILTVGIGSYFVYRTVKNAGFDPDLMRSNPGLALARMATAFNPDVDVVSTDDSAGTVTVREKKTGKVVTLKFDPDKKSMVVIDGDGKQAEFKISGDDKSGTLDVTTPDGSMKFGAAAAANAPSWVPQYPGAASQGTMSTQSGDGTSNTYTFKTGDSATKVLTYFEAQLKGSGYSISLSSKSDQGGMLAAESSDKKRTLMITAGTSAEGTEGSVTAIEKNK